MGYSDQKYLSDITIPLSVVGTGVYTSIASAAVGTVTAINGKTAVAFRGMSLKNVGLTVTTAPSTTLQPCTVALMDGTSTLATAVVTTLTAGATTTFSILSSNVVAGDSLTVNEYGTATASTASGGVTGRYDILLTCNRAFT